MRFFWDALYISFFQSCYSSLITLWAPFLESLWWGINLVREDQKGKHQGHGQQGDLHGGHGCAQMFSRTECLSGWWLTRVVSDDWQGWCLMTEGCCLVSYDWEGWCLVYDDWQVTKTEALPSYLLGGRTHTVKRPQAQVQPDRWIFQSFVNHQHIK